MKVTYLSLLLVERVTKSGQLLSIDVSFTKRLSLLHCILVLKLIEALHQALGLFHRGVPLLLHRSEVLVGYG